MTGTSLEKIVQLPQKLENVALIDDYIYTGRAFDLHFDGHAIRGNASLEKRKIVAPSEKEPPLLFIIGARLYNAIANAVNAVVAFASDNYVKTSGEEWSVTAGRWPYEYFISNGRTYAPDNQLTGYQRQLFANLSQERIIVDNEVFDAVFKPIDRQLMDYYRQAFP